MDNSQNYSFFNIQQTTSERTPATPTTDKYTPSITNTSNIYNMFGNIQKNIFDSFASESSFMNAVRGVFDNVENKVLTSDTLTQAAKISDEFSKQGEWLSISHDGTHASIRDAEIVYYEGNEQSISISHSKNIVLNVTKGSRDIDIFSSDNVISSTGDNSDRLSVSGSKNVIINSGGSNDGIGVLNSNNVIANAGNGDDRIFFVKTSDAVINSGAGNDIETISSSSDVVLNSGTGSDYTEIHESSGVVVNSGMGDDSISILNSNKIVLNGDQGNDVINVEHSANAIIDGGDGDDIITVNASTNTIVDGGAGNDTITASGIISGGTGDDYIKLYHSIFEKDAKVQDVIKYSKGDGNDIVEGVTDDTVIDLNGISVDEYDITESRNEGGTRVKTLTMKDGSGSITLVYNGRADNVKKQDNSELYGNAPEYARLNDVSVGQAD
ncbi:hypothetical protein [Seleniivibrio woodruffii]|uniref:hypothetical protein n=1 Tax=Seleniivibrio woodruffii TaxID=1078050 RepID=UPI00104EE0A5|nr:hypothetical protein [Seleniivibrio woodruffii]